MSTKRIIVWLLSFLPRMLSIKRCSLCKVLTVVLSTSCTWILLVIIDSSDVIQNMTSHMSRGLNGPFALQWTSRSYHENEKTRQNDVTVPDVLIEDFIESGNSGGVYFQSKGTSYGPGGQNENINDNNKNSNINNNDANKDSSNNNNNINNDNNNIAVGNSIHKNHHQTLKNVLVFISSETASSSETTKITEFLSELRIEHKTIIASKPLPPLVQLEVPQFSLFVFQDYIFYLSMDSAKKALLDDYCQTYQVGVLAFTESSRSAELEYFSGLGLKLQHRMKLRQFKLNPSGGIWHTAKPEAVYQEPLPSSDWTVFITLHETYKPLAYSTVADDWVGSGVDVPRTEFGCVVAVHDVGLSDGIHRIVLGHGVDFFLNDVIAMDAIRFLTQGKLGLSLERMLQVDVDDMFVGKVGIRTRVKDAEAMLSSQERIATMVPGFRYVLGYSGGMYLDGDDEEDLGDKKIVELASKFVWFDHMYRHLQPHNLIASRLLASMRANRKFAQDNAIAVSTDYMVTPHHSGVYPVYEPLYDAWDALKEEGVHITATSSEEYPRLVPHWGRRGFVYRGVMVVPRQTCLLYTHTIRFDDYHGGKDGLDQSLRGGYLFKLFLHTPIMVFMTHMSNYATDQLAQYSFEGVLTFLTHWTNVKVVSRSPTDTARCYFQMYPDEVTPLWTNPCDYNKHMEIWPSGKPCTNLPSFVIVGPQKTGTTALYSFLNAHPSLLTSLKDPVHFEEVQFFNGKEYLNGFDWYMNRFPQPTQTDAMLFEKSANYFDSDITPRRIASLLPRAKIVIIISEPGRRAYSWYQHLRSHNDPTALNFTFYDVISVPESGPKFLKDVRNRCLKPGMYATHLDKWLQYFPKDQIFLVDGDRITSDPVTVLHELQRFIKVKPFVDYKTKLRYDSEKGFFCLTETGCLSASKGRKYASMDPKSAQFLQTFYQGHNVELRKLLSMIGKPIPRWLGS